MFCSCPFNIHIARGIILWLFVPLQAVSDTGTPIHVAVDGPEQTVSKPVDALCQVDDPTELPTKGTQSL